MLPSTVIPTGPENWKSDYSVSPSKKIASNFLIIPCQIESSSIAPVSIDMSNHATPRPFKASMIMANQACSPTLQARGVNHAWLIVAETMYGIILVLSANPFLNPDLLLQEPVHALQQLPILSRLKQQPRLKLHIKLCSRQYRNCPLSWASDKEGPRARYLRVQPLMRSGLNPKN
jgi:hypothetical protein